MGKTLFILFFLLLHGYFCVAQDSDENESDDIKAVRSAYITNELKLSPEEAQQFWPVYNNYQKELRKAARSNPDDVAARRDAIANITRKYKGDFKRIIGSDARVNRAFTIEGDFRRKMIGEWKIRHPNQNNNNRQPLPQMRQQRMKKNG